jgi:hypothetical protein
MIRERRSSQERAQEEKV